MEPTQVAPTNSKQHKILVILLVVISLVAVAYLTAELYSTRKELDFKETQGGDVAKKTTVNYSQKDAQYTVTNVKNLEKGVFEINAFPNATFTVSKITRVEGLKALGCPYDFPEEIQKTIRLAGCYTIDPGDPALNNKSLIGFDIDVSNNSNNMVTGDIINIVYYESREGETVARIGSWGAVPFSSYSVAPFSDRKVSLATWIPDDVTKIELVYGLDDLTQYHLKLTDPKNADGKLMIDLGNSAITTKITLKPSTITKEESAVKTPMTDSVVKSKLTGARAYAETYYGVSKNYGVATNDCTGGMFGRDEMIFHTKDLIASNLLSCRSTGTSYAISSTLPQSKGVWCVDSSGASNEIYVNLVAGDTKCN